MGMVLFRHGPVSLMSDSRFSCAALSYEGETGEAEGPLADSVSAAE